MERKKVFSRCKTVLCWTPFVILAVVFVIFLVNLVWYYAGVVFSGAPNKTVMDLAWFATQPPLTSFLTIFLSGVSGLVAILLWPDPPAETESLTNAEAG